MLRGELQAGAVARGEQALVLRRDAPVHDRADGVENIVTGEVIRPRDLRPPGRLGAALRRHDLRAVAPQLHTRVGVDAVVNAGVTGDVAARHAGVRGVDDGPALQAGDVALPEIEVAAKRAQVTQTDDAARVELPAQLDVYHCDMHAFDMMRPQDARSVVAAETFNRQFAYARAHYFTPQREADDGEGRVR